MNTITENQTSSTPNGKTPIDPKVPGSALLQAIAELTPRVAQATGVAAEDVAKVLAIALPPVVREQPARVEEKCEDLSDLAAFAVEARESLDRVVAMFAYVDGRCGGDCSSEAFDAFDDGTDIRAEFNVAVSVIAGHLHEILRRERERAKEEEKVANDT